jgi:hypothetical protein
MMVWIVWRWWGPFKVSLLGPYATLELAMMRCSCKDGGNLSIERKEVIGSRDSARAEANQLRERIDSMRAALWERQS